MIVALILDPKATKGLVVDFIDPSIPIWIVDTPQNQALRGHTAAQITTFTTHFSAPLENAFNILATVYEHHPSATLLMIAGLRPEDAYGEEWNHFGLKFVRNDPAWMFFRRTPLPSE